MGSARQVNPRLIYTITLADSVAERLELDHDDQEITVDLIDAVDAHFAAGRWKVSAGEGPLAPLMERQRSNRWQGYFAISSLDVGVTKVSLPDNDDAAVRRNLQVSFASAKEHISQTVAFDGDLAIADLPRFAIRLPGFVKYTRRKENDETTYDSDEFSTGARFDLKLRTIRPFVGLFIDGQLKRKITALTASRELDEAAPEGFTRTERASFSTPYVVEPRRYRHGALGIDVFEGLPLTIPIGLPLTIKRLGLRVTRGTESNVPVGVSIGGEGRRGDTPLLDVLLSQGAQAMINQYFADHSDSFRDDVGIDITRARVDQDRLQIDAENALKWKWHGKDYTAEIKGRFRWYDSEGSAISPFLLASEAKVELRAVLPLWWRLALAPGYEYQRATIEGLRDDDPLRDSGKETFGYHKLDVKLSLPIMVRWGSGVFVR